MLYGKAHKQAMGEVMSHLATPVYAVLKSSGITRCVIMMIDRSPGLRQITLIGRA
jgi:hypothetical protein